MAGGLPRVSEPVTFGQGFGSCDWPPAMSMSVSGLKHNTTCASSSDNVSGGNSVILTMAGARLLV